MFKCDYCNKEFKNKGRLHYHHIYECKQSSLYDLKKVEHKSKACREKVKKASVILFNKKLGEFSLFKVRCHKCEKEFEVREREKLFPKKEKYFCSRSCANSRDWKGKFKDSNKKRSLTLKKRVKEKGKWGSILYNNRKYFFKKRIKKICPICNKEFEIPLYLKNRIYCSKECFKKDSPIKYRKWDGGKGGYRHNSGRGKRGTLNGIYYQSSWELAYLTWCFDKKVEIQRYEGHFEYINSKGEIKRYFPDFYLPKYDLIVEVKGPQDKEWENKKKGLPKETRLKVIDKKNIHFYLDYLHKKLLQLT